MTEKHKRLSRLVGATIRQETRQIEDLKIRNRQALDDLDKTNNALSEIDALIDQVENVIGQAMEESKTLDLSAIQSARKFLEDQQGIRKQRFSENQRAIQKVTKVQEKLKEEVLYVKGLQKVKATSDKAIKLEREKREVEEYTELWVQRFCQKDWETCK